MGVGGARVRCFDQALWFASLFLDYYDLAVSLDDPLDLKVFVSAHDQEAVRIRSHLAVERRVDLKGDGAGSGSALAGDRELWEARSGSSRPVDLLVEVAERRLIECRLRETQPVLLGVVLRPQAHRCSSSLRSGCSGRLGRALTRVSPSSPSMTSSMIQVSPSRVISSPSWGVALTKQGRRFACRVPEDCRFDRHSVSLPARPGASAQGRDKARGGAM